MGSQMTHRKKSKSMMKMQNLKIKEYIRAAGRSD